MEMLLSSTSFLRLFCSDLDLFSVFLFTSLMGGSEVSQKFFRTSKNCKPSVAAPRISLRAWSKIFNVSNNCWYMEVLDF